MSERMSVLKIKQTVFIVISFMVLSVHLFANNNNCLQEGKMLCAYFYDYQDYKHACELAKAGFNTILIKFNYNGGSFEELKRIKGWAEAAQKWNLDFYPIINFAGLVERNSMKGKYRNEVNISGVKLDNTPCPLDDEYWRVVISDRIEEIASLSKEVPIKGILIDLEMYGADHGLYTNTSCFCDDCFNKFIEIECLDLDTEVMPEERWSWIEKNQLENVYFNYLECRLTQLANPYLSVARKENPNISLGFLHYGNHWFFNGLAKAWGTPQLPVLILCERTYSSGYTEYIPGIQNLLKGKGISAFYIPGVWMQKYYPTPSSISAHIYHMSINSSGYWLFTSYSLYADEEKLTGDYRIAGTQEEYWDALKLAHSEVRNYLQSEGEYQSNLLIPQPDLRPIYPPEKIEIGDYTPPKLKPLTSNKEYTQAKPKPALRGKHFIHFMPEASDFAFEITFVQVGNYTDLLSYAVVDNNGSVLYESSLSPKETHQVEIIVEPLKTYSIIVVAEGSRNAFNINLSSRCFVYEASKKNKLALYERSCPLYFYVPQGCEEFWMNVAADGPAETAQVQILDPNGNVMSDSFIDREVRLRISVEKEQYGVWSIIYSNAHVGVLEDVYKIYFSENIPPFLSEHPNRLLVLP